MADVNCTVLVLIPKVVEPEQMSQFRPIALCNGIYKIVVKVLVNRLRPLLTDYIDDNQSAFIPDRLIMDNVLIAHELFHFLKHDNGGASRGAALKLDMEKAYERLSGQKVNFTKSNIYLSPATSPERQTQLCSLVDISSVADLGIYLQMPLIVGRNKNQSFGFLCDKVAARVRSWTKNLINYGGRVVYIKVVGQAIPTYIMGCYLIRIGCYLTSLLDDRISGQVTPLLGDGL
ncbi:hypothetical protein F3Y22_tig00117010pilonHSYRG00116 [Hibiscus syriacus]|uniref:Reverse transcriptase domain-containing protein n=1 Tax=Hibiscus syriacus TaxID=106335 RepID=A0A6A2X2K6_HIBSY|nr:hypothetical protein F3Y22_tig00117010pilonHSYRG00116 [Hibiscus syriacus]